MCICVHAAAAEAAAEELRRQGQADRERARVASEEARQLAAEQRVRAQPTATHVLVCQTAGLVCQTAVAFLGFLALSLCLGELLSSH